MAAKKADDKIRVAMRRDRPYPVGQQLDDLIDIAVDYGMYDAADWVRARINPETAAKCSHCNGWKPYGTD